jgi:hypothetical protein
MFELVLAVALVAAEIELMNLRLLEADAVTQQG